MTDQDGQFFGLALLGAAVGYMVGGYTAAVTGGDPLLGAAWGALGGVVGAAPGGLAGASAIYLGGDIGTITVFSAKAATSGAFLAGAAGGDLGARSPTDPTRARPIASMGVGDPGVSSFEMSTGAKRDGLPKDGIRERAHVLNLQEDINNKRLENLSVSKGCSFGKLIGGFILLKSGAVDIAAVFGLFFIATHEAGTLIGVPLAFHTISAAGTLFSGGSVKAYFGINFMADCGCFALPTTVDISP